MGVLFHRWSFWTRLHPALPRPAPLAQASDAVHDSSTRRLTLLLVRPSPGMRLLRPLLTSRSGLHRRPFRHEARSPQVRTHSFPAQPPDLRHFALTTRASRFLARSPCSAAPSVRFLFIGSQLRCLRHRMRWLPTVGRPAAVSLRFPSCGQLAAGLAPARVRPCWTHKKKAGWTSGLFLICTSNTYIFSIITCPKPEQDTCVAPSIKRAKS